jgi:hypothetical protein
MFLGCSNGAFCGVATMIVRWDQLEVDFFLVEKVLECLGAFVV